ncbi:MAG: hypothetical protein NWT02_03975 [Opitutales bacterium]|jgi:hypothetical protein|nr:hypothetical protein [Opitutales bacterium]MDP4643605.1 hypothetical protein [Opitutales bacterium]MDP4778313.1 hypothetical protein [Opitutales bacterium]MDP4884618.1 hypothetical protein [Opitutales bacterium]MDP5080579.1 hypothetical protein [Opitutales bacterium]
MKHTLKKIIFSLTALFPLLAQAGSFEAVSKHLDTDGSLIAYIDFEGDGAEISTKFNSIYQKLLEGGGSIPPIPVDFDLLFENLGFSSIQGMGLSSKQLSADLHLNRYVVETNGAPAGLFSLYGNSGAEPQAFTAAAMVPADATIAGCGPVDLNDLVTTVRTIMVQFMGPMGEGMADQYLMMPIPESEVTANDVIAGLSGRWDYAYKMDMADMEAPKIEFWVQISGSGELVSKLKSLGESMSIVFTEEANGELIADFSPMVGEDAPFGFFIKNTTNGDLVIYSDPNWGGSTEGSLLKDDPKFINLTKNLPAKALWFSYSGGFDILDTMSEAMEGDETMAPYLAAIMEAADYLVGDFYEPAAAAAYYDGDMLISEQYAGYSTKQLAMLVPTMFAAYPAMAFYGFQQVTSSMMDLEMDSEEAVVTNNLRQISAAADQYFLEEGKTSVTIEELVGPDKYIRELIPVAGESYEGMIITMEMDEISVTLESGQVVSLPR